MLKKLSALLFALVMVLAVVVPAFAAIPPEDEGIEPHYQATLCCGANINNMTTKRWDEIGSRVGFCHQTKGGCYDYVATKYYRTYCLACGTTQDSGVLATGYYCPKTGLYTFYGSYD